MKLNRPHGTAALAGQKPLGQNVAGRFKATERVSANDRDVLADDCEMAGDAPSHDLPLLDWWPIVDG